MTNKYQQSVDIICQGVDRDTDNISSHPNLLFLETFKKSLTEMTVKKSVIEKALLSLQLKIDSDTLNDDQVMQLAETYAKFVKHSADEYKKRGLPQELATNNLTLIFP